MMIDFTTWEGRQVAHKKLPQWLCAYLACGYADCVPQRDTGRRAINTVRDWLRGAASESDCRLAGEAAEVLSSARTAAAAAMSPNSPNYSDANAAANANAAAANAAYAAISRGGPTAASNAAENALSCNADAAIVAHFYGQVMAALSEFDLSDLQAQGPALDLLDELDVSPSPSRMSV